MQDAFIRSLVGIMVYMLLQKIKTVNHWIICFIMGAVILLKTNMG